MAVREKNSSTTLASSRGTSFTGYNFFFFLLHEFLLNK